MLSKKSPGSQGNFAYVKTSICTQTQRKQPLSSAKRYINGLFYLHSFTALQIISVLNGVLNTFTAVLNGITLPSLLDYWPIKVINVSFLNNQHNDELLP